MALDFSDLGAVPVSTPDAQPSDRGLLQAGNIDLSNRPKVQNPDGSYSTVRTITVDMDGKTVLLPTVIDGKIVSPDQAVQHYRQTGQHMGIFKDQQSADAYDQKLHADMGWNGPSNVWPGQKKLDFSDLGAVPVGQPEEKGIVRRAAEAVINSPALPIAGGVVGGIAGAPLGPGAIATAGLGGATGEAVRELAARTMGLPSPQTSTDAAKKIGIEGATQAAGEAGGQVLSAVGKAVAPAAKKVAGDFFQVLTKMKPEDAATLFKNPEAILPSTWAKAKAGWRAAAQSIGIPVDEVSPEMIKILSGDAKKMVFDTYGKMISDEPVSAAEAQTAKQALDIAVMPVAKTVRKNPLVSTLNQIRQAFVDRISQESPEMAAANKDYAIAATGKKFRSLVPRTTTGDPAFFRSSILPTIGIGQALFSHDPGDAVTGLAAQAAVSPLAIGSLIALAGGARFLAPYAGRLASGSLAELIRKSLQGKQNVSSNSAF